MTRLPPRPFPEDGSRYMPPSARIRGEARRPALRRRVKGGGRLKGGHQAAVIVAWDRAVGRLVGGPATVARQGGRRSLRDVT